VFRKQKFLVNYLTQDLCLKFKLKAIFLSMHAILLFWLNLIQESKQCSCFTEKVIKINIKTLWSKNGRILYLVTSPILYHYFTPILKD
jgi:hypothetical protein